MQHELEDKRERMLSMLSDWREGYVVYEKYRRKKQVTHLACWAHARRELERALDNDIPRAQKALLMIQTLYAVEHHQAREQNLSPQQVKDLLFEKSLPVINKLGKWIFFRK